MQRNFVYARAMIAATAVGVLSTFVTPKTAEAQAPFGSYRNSCRSITLNKGGVLQAECRTTNNSWQRSSLRMANCRNGDIANRDGRLVCANNQRGQYDNKRPGNRPGNAGRPGGQYDPRGHDNRDNRGNNGKYDNRNNRNDRKDRDDRNRGSVNTRSGIVLFTGTRWNGRTMNIRSDYMNLEKTGFNDNAASVRIVGKGTWRLCSDKNYGGRCVNVSSDVGDLNRLGVRNKISSIRRVR